MKENIVALPFYVQGQVDADGVIEFEALCGMTIHGVNLCAEAFTGSPTGFNIDVQVETADVITAVAANSAGTSGTWKTPELGGTQTPVHVDAGEDVEIDVNLTGGSTPTADFTLILWVALDG